jgi:hypothetical protein
MIFGRHCLAQEKVGFGKCSARMAAGSDIIVIGMTAAGSYRNARSSSSIASKRLKIEASESLASLPKYSIKLGRISLFFTIPGLSIID